MLTNIKRVLYSVFTVAAFMTIGATASAQSDNCTDNYWEIQWYNCDNGPRTLYCDGGSGQYICSNSNSNVTVDPINISSSGAMYIYGYTGNPPTGYIEGCSAASYDGSSQSSAIGSCADAVTSGWVAVYFYYD